MKLSLLPYGLLLVLLLTACGRSEDPPQKLFSELNRLSRAETFHQVVTLAQKNRERYPNSGKLAWILGEAQFRLGEFEEAIEALEGARQAGWGGLNLYQVLGVSHYMLGQYEEARPFLEKMIEFEPGDFETLKTLGYLYYHLGEGQNAIDRFERLSQEDPINLEYRTALDALKGLTGEWRGAQMIWHVDPNSGIQTCYPGGWKQEEKIHLGPAGKVATTWFSGTQLGEEGRFIANQRLVLVVHENASAHPLPRLFQGAFRKGDRDAEGQWFHPTRPDARATLAPVSREPRALARYFSGESMRWVFSGFDIRERGMAASGWSGLKGSASYSRGSTVVEDRYGNALSVHSLGIYDPEDDAFGFLLFHGPLEDERRVRQTANAIFNLTLFGGVVGIPPIPENFISPQEYEARIQGFLQAGQADRALREAQMALKVYPKDADLHFLVGESESALWHLPEAVAAYQEARKLGLSTYELESALGSLHLGLGEPAAAETVFLRGLKLKPADPTLLAGLGLANYRQGKLERAHQLFEQARLEAPQSQELRSYAQAVEVLRTGEPSESLRIFELLGRGVKFCVPVNWSWEHIEDEGDKIQIFFSEGELGVGVSSFDTGLIYIRYEFASNRVGRLSGSSPEEVVDSFLGQAFHRVVDPQKVVQVLSPIYRRGPDRYLLGGYAHTDQSRRRIVRILAYYEPDKDRLHTLTFRTTGKDLGDWESFVQVCFETAQFDSP